MANELNLEKTQFKIEEIMKNEEDEIALDHQAMAEDGWVTNICIPSDKVTYADAKWFRVPLVTGEDLIPPNTKPFEGMQTVNIGPKG